MRFITQGFQTILGTIMVLIGILILPCAYFAPTIVAFLRHKQNKIAIFALNFFAGWTLIGWVVALVWALTKDSALVATPPTTPV